MGAICSTFDVLAVDAEKAKFSFDGLALEKSGLFVANRCGDQKVAEFVKQRAVLEAEAAKMAKLASMVFQSHEELNTFIEELCAKVPLTGPNGVAVLKFFVAKFCSDSLTVHRMRDLAGHIASRQEDPEFEDAIAGILDKSHKPRYCRSDEDIVRPYGW